MGSASDGALLMQIISYTMLLTQETVQHYTNKSPPPKVIWEERVATLHGRECTRPLPVLLAAQCRLQTSPVTQPRVRYIHTAVLCVLYVRLTLCCLIPPKRKKFALLPEVSIKTMENDNCL